MYLRRLCIYGLLTFLFITGCKNVNLENSTDSPSKIFDIKDLSLTSLLIKKV